MIDRFINIWINGYTRSRINSRTKPTHHETHLFGGSNHSGSLAAKVNQDSGGASPVQQLTSILLGKDSKASDSGDETPQEPDCWKKTEQS